MLMLVQLHLMVTRPSRGDRHLQSLTIQAVVESGRQGRSSTLPRKISIEFESNY